MKVLTMGATVASRGRNKLLHRGCSNFRDNRYNHDDSYLEEANMSS
jgi:hypothetical protein